MCYHNPNLVLNKPEIFFGIKFGLKWITDVQAADELRNHFLLQECTYPDVDLMHHEIQRISDECSGYLNRLYDLQIANKTYNPVENYDRWEDFDDIRQNESSMTADGTGLDSEFPMDTTVEKNVRRNKSNSSSKGNSDESYRHIGRIHGNIGVTTGAQMIEGEIKVADIIYNLKQQLCKQFDDLFMITI